MKEIGEAKRLENFAAGIESGPRQYCDPIAFKYVPLPMRMDVLYGFSGFGIVIAGQKADPDAHLGAVERG